MHPREGWQAAGTPPRRGLSRRSFLQRSGSAGMMLGAAGGIGSLLEACGSGSGSSGGLTSNAIPLPRPDRPVPWPIFDDNKPIASGLAPEKNATLRIFNWVAYLNPQCAKDFG